MQGAFLPQLSLTAAGCGAPARVSAWGWRLAALQHRLAAACVKPRLRLRYSLLGFLFFHRAGTSQLSAETRTRNRRSHGRIQRALKGSCRGVETAAEDVFTDQEDGQCMSPKGVPWLCFFLFLPKAHWCLCSLHGSFLSGGSGRQADGGSNPCSGRTADGWPVSPLWSLLKLNREEKVP